MKNLSKNSHLAIFICVLISLISLTIQNEDVGFQNIAKISRAATKKTFEPNYVDFNAPTKRKIVSSNYGLHKVEVISNGMETPMRKTKQDKPQFREKPNLYTTVIRPKETKITKSEMADKYQLIDLIHRPYPTLNKSQYMASLLDSNLKGLRKEPVQQEKLSAGQFSIPVKTEKLKNGEPTKRKYITPEFLNHINERLKVEGDKLDNESKYLLNNFAEDAQKDLDKLDETLLVSSSNTLSSRKTMKLKMKRLMNLRKETKQKAKELLLNLRKRIKKIDNVSFLNKKLNNLIDKIYDARKNSESKPKAKEIDTLLKRMKSKK
jgi:hypothetical protein